MAKSKHPGAHLYERFDTRRGGAIYKCMIPGCPHFISRSELIINRLSRCWGECGRELVIDKELYQNRIKKPFCLECREERKALRQAMGTVRVVEEEDGNAGSENAERTD